MSTEPERTTDDRMADALEALAQMGANPPRKGISESTPVQLTLVVSLLAFVGWAVNHGNDIEHAVEDNGEAIRELVVSLEGLKEKVAKVDGSPPDAQEWHRPHQEQWQRELALKLRLIDGCEETCVEAVLASLPALDTIHPFVADDPS